MLTVLALPLLFFAILAVLYPFEIPQLTVTRTVHPSLIGEGQSVEVRILATNSGRTSCHVSIHEQDDGEIRLGAPGTFEATIEAGETANVRYRVAPPRGLYRLGSIELRFTDELGMRFELRTIDISTHFTVWPRWEPLAAADLTRGPHVSHLKIGRTPASLSGSGSEWLGIRGYYPGDPLRRINWRAWARTQQLFTNDYNSERSADTWIVLDARARAEVRIGEDSLFDCSVAAAASLCRVLSDRGSRVALFVYGGSIDFVSLGSGSRHVERIMTRLAAVHPMAHVAFATYANLPTRVIRPGEAVYLVTPLATGDEELIVDLSGAGYDITVVSPDPVAFEVERLEQDDYGKIAWRIVRLEREVALLTLIRGGCRVIDWQTNEPLNVSVVQSHRVGR
jgi:uncharacterized protein (DUF58 family)